MRKDQVESANEPTTGAGHTPILRPRINDGLSAGHATDCAVWRVYPGGARPCDCAPDTSGAVTLATDGYATSVSIFGRHLATFTIKSRAEQLARDLRGRLNAFTEARESTTAHDALVAALREWRRAEVDHAAIVLGLREGDKATALDLLALILRAAPQSGPGAYDRDIDHEGIGALITRREFLTSQIAALSAECAQITATLTAARDALA